MYIYLAKQLMNFADVTTHLKKLVKRFITLHSVYHIKIFFFLIYIPSLITLNIASQLQFKCSNIYIDYILSVLDSSGSYWHATALYGKLDSIRITKTKCFMYVTRKPSGLRFSLIWKKMCVIK